MRNPIAGETCCTADTAHQGTPSLPATAMSTSGAPSSDTRTENVGASNSRMLATKAWKSVDRIQFSEKVAMLGGKAVVCQGRRIEVPEGVELDPAEVAAQE